MIGLLIIATERYIDFLQPLITSADEYFLKGKDVTYLIFTNKDFEIKSNRKIQFIKIEHRKWPWMTLGRYRIFTDNVTDKFDYLYYIDADMLFAGDVGEEIFGEMVVTQHPGFNGGRGSPDRNKESLAYIRDDEKLIYVAGGFNGGSEYLRIAEILADRIEDDYSRGVIAVWHDESHLNRYLIDNPPTKILSPSYCFAEGYGLTVERKIMALDKGENWSK